MQAAKEWWEETEQAQELTGLDNILLEETTMEAICGRRRYVAKVEK